MSINIAIDGPAGAGKSCLAKMLADRLSYIYVDTGALYRAVGLLALRCNADTHNEDEINDLIINASVYFKTESDGQHVFLNDNDVTASIRTMKVAMAASDVSSLPCVRNFLMDCQRNIASKNNVVMDGRDIGTVILPDAQVKIFLTASPEIRAKRRLHELEVRGEACSDNYSDILDEMNRRDQNDATREIAPLKKADDAILLDNSDINIDETLEKALEIVKDIINV